MNVNKTGGVAQYSTSSSPTVRGNLTITAGTMLLQESNYLTVNGDVIIKDDDSIIDGRLNANTANINVGGNWTRETDGEFIPGTGTVRFVGAGAQNLTGSTFNNLVVNNGPSGYATVITENATVNGDLTVLSGKLLLNNAIYMNRSAAGGSFILAKDAILELKGLSNFPANFNTNTIDTLSTVLYSGTIDQNIAPITYGILKVEGSGVKSLLGSTIVKGEFNINSASATVNGKGQTLTIHKSLLNIGTFKPVADGALNPLEGTLVLAKSSYLPMQITGNVTVNNMVVQAGANYNLKSNLEINGNIDIVGTGYVYENPYLPVAERVEDFRNNGTLNADTAVVNISGDFKNAGILKASGTAKFLGTRLQQLSY